MSMRISHEAIYQYIYVLPRGSLKQSLIKGLRQERAWEAEEIQGPKERGNARQDRQHALD